MPTEPADGTTVRRDLLQRPLTVADAAQIAEIKVLAERTEPADDHWSVAEVTEQLQNPLVDLPRASTGVFDGEVLLGYAAVSVARDETIWRATMDVGLRPGVSGEVADRVLRTAEQRAERWHAETAAGIPGELRLWYPEERRSLRDLTGRHGFATWRYFFVMRRELRGPVDVPPIADGYLVRPFDAGDTDRVRIAHNQAFADHWGSVTSTPERWRANVIDSPAFRPDHSFVALAGSGDGEVAGYVMAEEFDAETEARGFRSGYIGLVGTTPTHRGRGVAAALLGVQLASLRDAGYRVAELEVDSDSPTGAGRIYQRAGFVQRHRSVVVGKHLG